MYKNRLSLKSKKISPNTHPHLFIRRSEMPYEGRIKNVDHVCALLTESRFGTDFYYEPVPDFRDIPDSAPIDFCDLLFDSGDKTTTHHVSLSQGRKGRNTTCREFVLFRDANSQAGSLRSDNFSGTHEGISIFSPCPLCSLCSLWQKNSGTRESNFNFLCVLRVFVVKKSQGRKRQKPGLQGVCTSQGRIYVFYVSMW